MPITGNTFIDLSLYLCIATTYMVWIDLLIPERHKLKIKEWATNKKYGVKT